MVNQEIETFEVMGDIYNSLTEKQQAALDDVINCLKTGKKLSLDNYTTMAVLASTDEVDCRNCLLYIVAYADHKRRPNPVTNIADHFKETEDEYTHKVLDPISARWFKTNGAKARQIEQKLHNHKYTTVNEYFEDCGLPILKNAIYDSKTMSSNLLNDLGTVELELFPITEED